MSIPPACRPRRTGTDHRPCDRILDVKAPAVERHPLRGRNLRRRHHFAGADRNAVAVSAWSVDSEPRSNARWNARALDGTPTAAAFPYHTRMARPGLHEVHRPIEQSRTPPRVSRDNVRRPVVLYAVDSASKRLRPQPSLTVERDDVGLEIADKRFPRPSGGR